jgi:hypothetical protein
MRGHEARHVEVAAYLLKLAQEFLVDDAVLSL